MIQPQVISSSARDYVGKREGSIGLALTLTMLLVKEKERQTYQRNQHLFETIERKVRLIPLGTLKTRSRESILNRRTKPKKGKELMCGGWILLREFSFPRLIVVPLSSHEIDGVRKEKERLTAASIS